MKLLFFIDSLTTGGKERRLTELLKALNVIPNIQFELVIMNKEIHYKEVLDLNINIHYLIRKSKKDISVFKKFYSICKDYRPDIIHSWNDMTALIAIPSCKLLHIKLINGMVCDTSVKQNILNKNWVRAKLTFPFSDKIIGNSLAGLAAYGAAAKKSYCIYNGIDFKRFDNLKDPIILRREIFGNDKHLFVVGMVAAFEPRKDYKTLIEAAFSIITPNNGVRFLLVGDGSEFTKIKSSIPDEMKDKIIFLGKRRDVESIVDLFDVGVLLTNSDVHGEGVSNSIIEYMSLAKPVIATRGGGTNEVVIDNQNGLLIDPKNSNELIEKLEKLISNKELRTRLGSTAYQIAREKFELKKMAKDYISVYQDLLQVNQN